MSRSRVKGKGCGVVIGGLNHEKVWHSQHNHQRYNHEFLYVDGWTRCLHKWKDQSHRSIFKVTEVKYLIEECEESAYSDSADSVADSVTKT